LKRGSIKRGNDRRERKNINKKGGAGALGPSANAFWGTESRKGKKRDREIYSTHGPLKLSTRRKRVGRGVDNYRRPL